MIQTNSRRHVNRHDGMEQNHIEQPSDAAERRKRVCKSQNHFVCVEIQRDYPWKNHHRRFVLSKRAWMESVLRFEGWERAPELAEKVKETNIGEAFRLRQSWTACSRGDRREWAISWRCTSSGRRNGWREAKTRRCRGNPGSSRGNGLRGEELQSHVWDRFDRIA